MARCSGAPSIPYLNTGQDSTEVLVLVQRTDSRLEAARSAAHSRVARTGRGHCGMDTDPKSKN